MTAIIVTSNGMGNNSVCGYVCMSVCSLSVSHIFKQTMIGKARAATTGVLEI